MFGIIKKMFIVQLSSIVNASKHTKYVLSSDQKFKIQPTLINVHPNEHIKEFHYYPFAVKLNKSGGSFNSLNDLSNKVEVSNWSVSNMTTGTNKSKTLSKHFSCECKYRFDAKNVIEIYDGITINVDVTVKYIIYAKKIMFGILLHVIVKMENI